MPTVFQTKDRSGKPHHNWRFKFIDHTGKRRTKTGLPTKNATEKLAWKLQAEHDEIRKGLRPPLETLKTVVRDQATPSPKPRERMYRRSRGWLDQFLNGF